MPEERNNGKQNYILIISLLVLILILAINFVRNAYTESLQVMDICSLAVSVISLAFEIAAKLKSRREEKTREEKRKEFLAQQKNYKELLEEKCRKVQEMQVYSATDEIPDYPTYLDLPLSELCRLYRDFHGENARNSIQGMRNYCKEVQDVLEFILANAAYFSAETKKQRQTLNEDVKELLDELVALDSGVGEHSAKVLYAKEESVKDQLHEQGSQLCKTFDRLYEKVLQNKQAIRVLSDTL